MDVAEASKEPPGNLEKRCRLGCPHLACVADEEVVMGHAQWGKRDLKARWNATRSSALEGEDAATSPRIADGCDRVSGQEPAGEGGKLNGGFW